MRSDFDRMNESSVLTFGEATRSASAAAFHALRISNGTTVKTWISIVVWNLWETPKSSFWECRKNKVIARLRTVMRTIISGSYEKNRNTSLKRIILYTIYFSTIAREGMQQKAPRVNSKLCKFQLPQRAITRAGIKS